MSGVRVQWEADLGPLRDLEAPCGLHIGPRGKVGWDGSLVGVCGNPPAQQVALFSGGLHAHQYALCYRSLEATMEWKEPRSENVHVGPVIMDSTSVCMHMNTLCTISEKQHHTVYHQWCITAINLHQHHTNCHSAVCVTIQDMTQMF